MVNFNFLSASLSGVVARACFAVRAGTNYIRGCGSRFSALRQQPNPQIPCSSMSCSLLCYRYLPYKFHVTHEDNCIYKLQISWWALNVSPYYNVNLFLILLALICKHCVPSRYTFQVDAMFLQYSWNTTNTNVSHTHIDWCPRIERTPYVIQQNWISSPERYAGSHVANEGQTLGLQCARVVITSNKTQNYISRLSFEEKCVDQVVSTRRSVWACPPESVMLPATQCFAAWESVMLPTTQCYAPAAQCYVARETLFCCPWQYYVSHGTVFCYTRHSFLLAEAQCYVARGTVLCCSWPCYVACEEVCSEKVCFNPFPGKAEIEGWEHFGTYAM